MNKQPSVICDSDPDAMSIDSALQRIASLVVPLESKEIIDCDRAQSRVSAENILSPFSVPSFRASAMDGYAMRMADCMQPMTISGQSLAGHPGEDRIPAGTCQRITTGARVPDDAEAVVQQENVEKRENEIIVSHAPAAGLNIRMPGSDCKQGACLLPAGCVLGAAQLALLAAHGIRRITVRKLLKVAVFSTGDELINPGDTRKDGLIHDANRPLIKALLNNPAIEVLDLGIAKDSVEEIESTLGLSAEADLIVSSGGVSVGDADHVREVLDRCGDIDLWKIAMKPGRPLTFGIINKRTPYFGLPGNPVSAAITSLFFVRPAIARLLGLELNVPPPLHLALQEDLHKNPGRLEYQRGRMICKSKDEWWVSTTGIQDSHVLSSLNSANCLIELPVESCGAKAGDKVKVIPFSHFKGDLL
ncbi:MAG: gephyrin-like molybdotransferase Glp [Granulosicoccus sp.]